MRQVKIGLALGSGAAKGWAHIGVINALQRAGIAIDVVAVDLQHDAHLMQQELLSVTPENSNSEIAEQSGRGWQFKRRLGGWHSAKPGLRLARWKL